MVKKIKKASFNSVESIVKSTILKKATSNTILKAKHPFFQLNSEGNCYQVSSLNLYLHFK